MKKFEWDPQLTKIDETIDLSSLIKTDDIISIEETFIEGDIISRSDYIEVSLNVNTVLTAACAKTLKPVEVELDFELDLLFSNTDDGDYGHDEIEDLYNIIYGHILIEKPYVVHHPDAKDLKFEKPKGHIAFADLTDK